MPSDARTWATSIGDGVSQRNLMRAAGRRGVARGSRSRGGGRGRVRAALPVSTPRWTRAPPAARPSSMSAAVTADANPLPHSTGACRSTRGTSLRPPCSAGPWRPVARRSSAGRHRSVACSSSARSAAMLSSARRRRARRHRPERWRHRGSPACARPRPARRPIRDATRVRRGSALHGPSRPDAVEDHHVHARRPRGNRRQPVGRRCPPVRRRPATARRARDDRAAANRPSSSVSRRSNAPGSPAGAGLTGDSGTGPARRRRAGRIASPRSASRRVPRTWARASCSSSARTWLAVKPCNRSVTRRRPARSGPMPIDRVR